MDIEHVDYMGDAASESGPRDPLVSPLKTAEDTATPAIAPPHGPAKSRVFAEVPWNDGGTYKDDFTAEIDGYMLRVEQMDKNVWWWQVYFPDGTQADPWCDLSVPSEYIAKRICEMVYALHRVTPNNTEPLTNT